MTNKSNTPLLLLVFLFLALIYPLGTANAAGNVNVLFGFKLLDKDDWDPLQEQSEGGILVDFKSENWPLSIAVDFLGSVSPTEVDTVTVPGTGQVHGDWTGDTDEFNIGVRKYWGSHSVMRPFLGGGLSLISAQLEGKTGRFDYVRDTDYGVGLWINGGVSWALLKHLNIGFDFRLSGAEVTLFDQKYKAGGFHAGFLLGYHWD